MTETGVETSYVSLFYGNPRNASHPKTVKTAISCEWSSEIRISGGNKKEREKTKMDAGSLRYPPEMHLLLLLPPSHSSRTKTKKNLCFWRTCRIIRCLLFFCRCCFILSSSFGRSKYSRTPLFNSADVSFTVSC